MIHTGTTVVLDRSWVVMLALTPYALGQIIGLLLLVAFGATFIVVGFRRWQSAPAAPSASGLPNLNQPTPRAMPSPPSVPTPSTPTPAGMDDSFFGGTVTSASTSLPRGVNPAISDTRLHPSYGSNARPTPASSNSIVPVVLMVVGVVMVGTGLFQTYNLWMNGRTGIHMPDQLLGMERVEEDSVLGQLIEDADSYYDQEGLTDLQLVAYGDPTQFAFVSAGRLESVSGDEANFFAGLEDGLATTGVPGMTLTEVDPGPQGGQMRCVDMSAQQVAACAWVSDGALNGDGVVGVLMLSGSISTTYEDAVLAVRSEIEG